MTNQSYFPNSYETVIKIFLILGWEKHTDLLKI